MEDLYEKTIKEELVYQGDYLTIVNSIVELPNGKQAKRDMIRHPGAVAILAFIDDDKILMVEQFRKPVEKILLEIPAGKINIGEDPLQCAKRELEEETGYKSDSFVYLGKFAPAPGFCDEYIHLFKATKLASGKACFDDDEFINVKIYSIKEIKNMIKEGKIEDAKTMASLIYIS
ncbi:ADP-ribose pyrophosphatase [Clostridium polyendosporum]|uniref:ADP-ribose pyrophosphatase n=1 Tax=Clostridium polyendosporum TaxID=69208 RepID=A0A919VKU7_9CLOT|nr:NUDIX hydrolase [Clostridium polyendosporum]GIM27933.1 ADP-ribose pyrophosphatase [Clostridium polyendosporum]